MDLLSDLNPEQRDAVTFGAGPLLIVAGVGTGKTTVITRRIAWLISRKVARPAEILALTFTDRAAAEMEERVDLLVPYGYVEAQIGTFHAFCERILRENAILLGLSPDYRVLTEPEQAIFLKDRLFDLPLRRFRPLGNPIRHLHALLTLFSRAKDEDVSPDEYAAHVDRQSEELAAIPDPDEREARAAELADQRELADAYAAYQRLLAEAGCVDFGDLITLVLRLFRDHPHVLARYQSQFRHILVDEFQDTNHAQFELLRLLARHRSLTVCGDDDQSIYKFRGAAISNILSFQDAYPDAHLVVLTRNYRSTQAILDAAYRLIQYNNPDRLEVRAGIDKRLTSSSGRGRPPIQRHFETLEEECDFVASTIADRHRAKGRPYNDFAILVRSNAQADSFLQSLNLEGIPWRFSGSRGLYDQEEIRAAIALLRVLADPHDDLSLHHLAGSFLYGVPGEDLSIATRAARRRNQSLLETFRLARGSPDAVRLSEAAGEPLDRLLGDLESLLPLASRERTGELLYRYFAPLTGSVERWSNSPDPRDLERVQNLAKLFAIVERFSRVTRYDRVAWFVEYLDALIEAGDNPPVGDAGWDADAVHVLTIHQAKGLEYPIVFLVGLVAGRFPSADRRDPLPLPGDLIHDIGAAEADSHRQEERRLFYVGMTRARDDLYLTSAQDYGGKRPRKPSPFVAEALDLDAAQLVPMRRSALAAIHRYGPPPEGPATARGDARAVAEPAPPDPTGPLLSLSHRQVDDYLTCPLKYRYIHLLGVPIRQHHTVLYGNAIHQAIRVFNLHRHAGRETSLEEIQDVFRTHWRSEGFLTREHEELRLEEGLRALAAFHAHETAEGAVPAYVERRFSVVEDGVRLVGVFDRIDRVDRAGTIIDYKTSDVRDEDHAERRTRESRQLAIYALAYRRMFGELPAAVELRFLTPELVIGRHEPTEAMIARAREEIATAADGIRAARFPADPAYRACPWCPYAMICPSKQAG